jgi:3-hydroxyisobutyrate dehydrogenase
MGLGAMGYQMAKRLAIQLAEPNATPLAMRKVLVWNRTARLAAQHAEEFRSVDISGKNFGRSLMDASVVFMCLPTSDVTFQHVQDMAPNLAPNAIVVDCCSGHPIMTRKIAAWLQEAKPGVRYMDCPISGGPRGASKGTLAAMLGGDQEAVEIVRPHIQAFASNIVHLGPTGAGHAVKAVNNACNVSNLLCLHEGLLALRKMGVDPSAALEVINKSSGRSLMSQDRVPQEVVSGDFNYGFKLGLMRKDLGIAVDLMDEFYPNAQVYKRTLQVHQDAMADGVVNYDSDYTEVVKHQELQAGVMLRPGEVHAKDEQPPVRKTAKASEADVTVPLAENKALRAEL